MSEVDRLMDAYDTARGVYLLAAFECGGHDYCVAEQDAKERIATTARADLRSAIERLVARGERVEAVLSAAIVWHDAMWELMGCNPDDVSVDEHDHLIQTRQSAEFDLDLALIAYRESDAALRGENGT